ncbi:MAG TPA: hypothetical protein VHS96_03540, partial [Bacteroidia bacterium]|nr:hypothetical protein [Bacteroidia bacterium]
MKKFLLYAMLLLACGMHAQTNNLDRLDLGNFIAPIRADGQLFQNSTMGLKGLEWPKTSVVNDKRTMSFAAHIWYGGLKPNGDLAVAAETYGQTGQTFHPGLYNFDGALWDKVWKISRTELDLFRTDFANNTINFANYPVIQNWPAFGTDLNGNTRACAPLVDMDNDPLHYTPTAGDYPEFPGDQAIYFQFADFPPTPTAYLEPTGIEVRAFAYVFDCQELQDVLFLKYDLTNQSGINYTDFQLGLWNDLDIGNFADDYLATDPSRDLFIGYNGDAFDETAFGYGLNPPALGWTCLTGDASGAMYYNNDLSTKGNPETANHYYGYLSNLWKDGSVLVDNGLDGWQNTSPGAATQFPYSGDPGWCGGLGSGWYEMAAGNQPFDRRGLLSIAENSFAPGETKSFTFSMLMARDLSNQNLGSVCKLLAMTDSLHLWWETDRLPCNSSLTGVDEPISSGLEASLFPN